VRSAGVLVGRVADIHFDNARYQADVSLALDQRYKFPKDTSASILTSGLLGETYVGLEAGGEEQKLKTGDRITITQSAVVLEKLIGQFLFSKAQESPAAGAGAPAAAAAPAPAAGAGAKK
ncbi:MAG TPA: outer membrane lipid asymmetry maintenance protein MlaD, partial [Usitatibacter sp.]|nr:outer membrane lipid asymmetry maintenance protein MlaD [Usitatibacter sp.]